MKGSGWTTFSFCILLNRDDVQITTTPFWFSLGEKQKEGRLGSQTGEVGFHFILCFAVTRRFRKPEPRFCGGTIHTGGGFLETKVLPSLSTREVLHYQPRVFLP